MKVWKLFLCVFQILGNVIASIRLGILHFGCSNSYCIAEFLLFSFHAGSCGSRLFTVYVICCKADCIQLCIQLHDLVLYDGY